MKNLTLGLCLLAVCGPALPQELKSILARMDQSAPTFRSMSANVEMVEYKKVLDDTTTENGTLEMQRLKAGDVRAILDFSKQTDPKMIAFLGKKVRIYYPRLRTYQDYEVGKNSDVLNQFLLLGFGSSGKELAQSYTIELKGTEKVAGQDTAKLLLLPKDAKVLERLQKVEMWIPNDAAYPVQQQFYEPSGNYRKLTYTGIKLNLPIKGTLELNLPPGVTRQSS